MIYTIAEIGGNHEGNFDVAKELLNLACETEVNAVKFQIYYADTLVNKVIDEDRWNHFKKFELTIEQHIELAEQCKNNNKDYLASIWDKESFKVMAEYMPYIKIGSGDLNSGEFLRLAASTEKPIILSTGLANISEINESIQYLRGLNPFYENKQNIILLQCTSMYPIDYGDANLNCMIEMANRFRVVPGYSDHTIDSHALEVAASIGAEFLEFHFTNDKKNTTFRDHKVSLDKNEVNKLIDRLKIINLVKGKKDKSPAEIEIKTGHTLSFRRTIYFSKNLKKGSKIDSSCLISQRPLTEPNGMLYDSFIGKKIVKDVLKGSPVKLNDLSD